MIVLIHNDMELWDFQIEGLKSRDDFYDIPLSHYCSKLQRLLRKVFHDWHLPSRFVIGRKLRKVLKELKAGDKVILSDYTALCLYHAINDSINQDVRVTLWLWNPIKNNEGLINKIELLKSLNISCCSFDREDAKKWGLRFLNTFYNLREIKTIANEDYFNYDFYFLGVAKDRADVISDLQEKLSAYKCLFIVPSQPSQYITYTENIQNVKSSKCIVEIVQQHQHDITLRPLEAIAYSRKLITNNIHIKDCPFYTSDNIFIWGVDRVEKLDDFLNTPYKSLDKKIIEKYDINYWLDRV